MFFNVKDTYETFLQEYVYKVTNLFHRQSQRPYVILVIVIVLFVVAFLVAFDLFSR